MFKILVVLIVIGFILWRFRVPIMAKILGQPESRIQRQIDRRRKKPAEIGQSTSSLERICS
mgnify:CR=1 FL=1